MLTFNEDTHTYWWNGIRIPSVTEIMKVTGISKGFSGIDPYVLDRARRRGSAVHEITEILDRGLEPDMSMVDEDIYDDVCNMVDAWEKYKDERGIVITSIEKPVYYQDLTISDIPLYAGTIDRTLEADSPFGIHSILDIKTSTTLSQEVSVQLALYALAHETTTMESTTSIDALRVDKAKRYYDWSLNTDTDEWKRVARIASDSIYRYHNWEIHKNKRGMKRV
jgi:hypothetical protein